MYPRRAGGFRRGKHGAVRMGPMLVVPKPNHVAAVQQERKVQRLTIRQMHQPPGCADATVQYACRYHLLPPAYSAPEYSFYPAACGQ